MSTTPHTTPAAMNAGRIRAAMPPAVIAAPTAGTQRIATRDDYVTRADLPGIRAAAQAASPAQSIRDGIPRKDLADLAGLPVSASDDEIFDAIAPKVAAKLTAKTQNTARPPAQPSPTSDDALYAAMYGDNASQASADPAGDALYREVYGS